MTTPVGFGILAPGAIAALVARDLARVPGAALVAVGSRDPARSERFAHEYGGTAYDSYDGVLADPRVDVVYVASPNTLHLALATRALDAGKHVLCEKPLTVDRAGSEQLVATARSRDRFLMEAMWTACHPVVRDLAARVRSGDFGTPRQLEASFCFASGAARDHRLRDPDLGGGALLDLGCYPLTFAHLLLGPARALRATGVLDAPAADAPHRPGVDLDVMIAARYPGDAVAGLAVSIAADRPVTATLGTDTGWVEVPARFHHPDAYVFHPTDGEPVRFGPPEPVLGVGYGNEIAEVVRCVREGLRESPLVPWAQTLLIMGQLDDLRGQVAQQAQDSRR